jgi:hypothetical protein
MDSRPDQDPFTDPSEEDRRLLESIRRDHDGAAVAHRLCVPTREAAEGLAAIVLNEGHDAEVRGPTDDRVRPWCVIATTHADDTAIVVAQRRLEELAAEYGGRYDGVETPTAAE